MKSITPSFAVLFALAFTLTGCGDGSSTTADPVAPTAVPANTAPTLDAPTGDIVVEEGSEDVVFTVTANDADGDTLSFSLSGADAASFTLDPASGALQFTAAPDFEAPADVDADNRYDIVVGADDGNGGTASQAFSIVVTDMDERQQGLYREPVFSAVTRQNGVEYAPGLRADIFFAPENTDPNRPLMILASGGGFIVQSRNTVSPIAQDFARRGYLVATIDYRVLFRFPRDQAEAQVAATRAVHDMFAAVRSARAEDGFLGDLVYDENAIIVGGESAGGVMAITAATLDPDDTISSPAIRDFLDANGSVFGNVGNNLDESSIVQAAMPLSGAVNDLAIVDADSAPVYAAHEEFDFVVPCDTAAEGATGTGTQLSGGCVYVPALQAAGVDAELFLVAGSSGHVTYTQEQREMIYAAAADFFADRIIDAP